MNGKSLWLLAGQKVRNMTAPLSFVVKVGLATLAITASAQLALAQSWAFDSWTLEASQGYYYSYSSQGLGLTLMVTAPYPGSNPNTWQSGDPAIPVTIFEYSAHDYYGGLDFVADGFENNSEDPAKYKLVGLAPNAFAGSSIDSIRFPNTLERIGPHAFDYADYLNTIELDTTGSAVLTIDPEAFANTDHLTDLIIKGPPPSFGSDAFREMPIDWSHYQGVSVAMLYVDLDYMTEWSAFVDGGQLVDFTSGLSVPSMLAVTPSSETYNVVYLSIQWLSNPTPSSTCTVTFNSSGGSAVAQQVKIQGTPYGVLPIPVRTNYTFDGWWATVAGIITQITSTSIVPSVPTTTLYARWTAVPPPPPPPPASDWEFEVWADMYGTYTTLVHPDGWRLEVLLDVVNGNMEIWRTILGADGCELNLPSMVWNDDHGMDFTLNSIAAFAFEWEDMISVRIPSTVEIIGSQAFTRCAFLSEVVFGDMSPIAEIDPWAFSICPNLTTVTFEGAPPGTFSSNAFLGCDSNLEIGIYLQYVSDWEDIVASGDLNSNTAVSYLHGATYGIYIPLNILNFTSQPHPSVDGHDGIGGTGDDIIIPGGEVDGGTGYITVPGTSGGSDVKHQNGSNLEGGDAPGGSIIVNPDIVIRPGTGNDPEINNDGTIYVTPGNSIDIDGDGLPPWVVPEDGKYDPRTGIFTPDDPSHPPFVVPPTNLGNLIDALISTISVNSTLDVTLTWPDALIQYGVGTQSVLFGKVDLLEAGWTPLSEAGLSLSAISNTGAVIPGTLVRSPGENYRFFKRMVRQP